MFRGSHRKGWLLGLALLGVILGAAEGARAAGIKVSGGGIKQLGDPFYFYIVDVSLDPTFTMGVFDSFTLHMVAGLDNGTRFPPGSTTSAPGGNPSGPWAAVITNEPFGNIPNYSPPTSVPFGDVQFINAGFDITNTGTTEQSLGTFLVLTAVSLPVLPENYTVTIGWTAILNHGTATDSGTVTLGIIHAVPEPASVVLLGSGAGLAILAYRKRRPRA
jgi:hypothetical protein